MWQFVFWCSLALVLYVYIGYPALLALIARLRRRPRPADVDGPPPSVCLIVSAFNEEKVLRRKIENSLALQYPGRLSIVVASDGSTDGTLAIAEDYRDMGVDVHHSPQRRGKNAVLNDVVRRRTEDVIVFTDANSLFAPDAVARLVEALRDPSVGCVVGELSYSRDLTSVGEGESLYWRYEKRIKELEGRLGSVLVANGSIFAVRRGLLRDLFYDVANDFQVPFDVASQGMGTVYERRALAVERSAELWAEEFDRKVRIVMRGVAGAARMRGRVHGMRLWQLVSHKLLRWSVAPVLALMFAATAFLAAGSVAFTTLFAAQVVFYAAALIGWRVRSRRRFPKLLYVPFYFVMVNAAAMVALLRFANGHRQVVWEKAESTRLERFGDATIPGAMEPVSAVAEAGARRRLIEK